MTATTIPVNPEVALYTALDTFVAPLVRAGLFSPGPMGPGFVVVETVGRRTGQPRPVTLLGFAIGDVVLVSTIRGGQAQWVKNLAKQREVRWWRWGQEVRGHATVVAPGTVGRVPHEAHAWVDDLVAVLEPWVLTGWRFAVLTPGAVRT
ncbi:MAG: nitroreductase/quinone reductase family protein [Dehalococcoidia bacterium]